MTIKEQISQLENVFYEAIQSNYDRGYDNGYVAGQAKPDTATLERVLGKKANYGAYLTSLDAINNGLRSDVVSAGGTVGENDTLDDTIDNAKTVFTNRGYTNGRIDEQDLFWSRFQNKMDNYGVLKYAFYGWDMTLFQPRHDIRAMPGETSLQGLFGYTGITNPDKMTRSPYSLKDLLNDRDVSLITTGVKDLSYMFENSTVIEVPSIDLTSAALITNMFHNCPYLTTIDELKVAATTPPLNCFNQSLSLEKLIISGTIGKTPVQMPSTKLSKESIVSIINALSQDVPGVISLSKTACANAFAGASAELNDLKNSKPSWTFSFI